MKMVTCCPECMKKSPWQNISEGIGTLIDEGYIEFTCERGHSSNIYLQEFKFEYLFYQACKHFVNAEYEESVMLFANSLERFYEFFIKMYARKKTGNNEYVDKKLIKKIKRSENQLGAFAVLYFILFNKEPPMLNDDETHLRNNVVHNGKLISKDDAQNYGKRVFDIITDTIKEIRKDDSDLIQNEIQFKFEVVSNKAKGKNVALTGSKTNYISFTNGSEFTSFDNLMENVKQFEKGLTLEAITARRLALSNLDAENEIFISKLKDLIEANKLIDGLTYPILEDVDMTITEYHNQGTVKTYSIILKTNSKQYQIHAVEENGNISIT